jgi:excisionase family DNA binding protein
MRGDKSDDFLSLRQAAEKTGLSASRMRRLAEAGVLKARKTGAYWIVSASALAEFMELERPAGISLARRKRRPSSKGKRSVRRR